MPNHSLRLTATALSLVLLGLSACSSKSADTSGMSGTIAPAARVEDTQVEAKDVKVEEPAPPSSSDAPNKDVDAALTGSNSASGHSAGKSVGGHSAQSGAGNRSSNAN